MEPNPFMHFYLRKEADRISLPIKILVGTADTLPVGDSSVDVVISTLVLCCVPSPQRCLQEVLRVLKPGGRFIFIEVEVERVRFRDRHLSEHHSSVSPQIAGIATKAR